MKPARLREGTRVRWIHETAAAMPHPRHKNEGVVCVHPFAATTGNEVGAYVLWAGLREPMLSFYDDLELAP